MISSVDMARPMFSPKVRLRDSGEEQVATRSPSPASPMRVSGFAPSRTASRGVSARPRGMGGPGGPARHARGVIVVAQAEPGGHARRNADDVLERAADLPADHVRRGVGP